MKILQNRLFKIALSLAAVGLFAVGSWAALDTERCTSRRAAQLQPRERHSSRSSIQQLPRDSAIELLRPELDLRQHGNVTILGDLIRICVG